MSNPAHLVRKQSSRELRPKPDDSQELREIKAKLIPKPVRQESFRSTVLPTPVIEESETAGESEPSGSERETWDNKFQFLLATIGYAVGLGSVWRFPYLTQRNGGGAFLIPFFIMLFILGIPLFYLELAIGQRLRKGSVGVWSQVSPYLAGIGLASCFVSVNVALYYNTIIAWCLFYLYHSFQQPLPWSSCPQGLSTNLSLECNISSPTKFFWYRQTLDISSDINQPESFNWNIAACLIAAWFLTYLCMAKGIASSGKVVYITATFPYIVLFIFFVRGITLEGMEVGLKHLFTPDFDKLKDPVVWLEAGTQIFFSFGLAFGGLIAFSSYNPPNNNCFRDAVTVGLLNACTALFASIVVFSVLGFKAHSQFVQCQQNRELLLNNSLAAKLESATALDRDQLSEQLSASLPVCDIQKELENSASGTGLAFIVFTEAINQFPAPAVWSVLFFLMLFTLGIDSEFGTLEGVITCIVDFKLLPSLRKEILTGIVCLVGCLISLIFAHGGGNYLFVLFDDFSGNLPLLIVALFESIGVAWVYGTNSFSYDIETMTGHRPHWYWQFCWRYLSPLTMLLILLASVAKQIMDGASYEAWDATRAVVTEKPWPGWAWAVIISLVLMSVLWIPIVAVLKLFGKQLIPTEDPAWFPVKQLRLAHELKTHKTTLLEKALFCIHDDGSEGVCTRIDPPKEDEEDDLDAMQINEQC